MKVRCTCHQCHKKLLKEAGAVNRAKRKGLKIFCNKTCFGLSRRKYKTKTQKELEKRLYDMQYRKDNREKLKRAKAEYFQRTYDPIQAAKDRKKRMTWHVEYCRQPRYKKYKRDYDARYRAIKTVGPYWESFILLQKIEKEIDSRMSKYDISLFNGTLNKAQLRRRHYERLIGGYPQGTALGNP